MSDLTRMELIDNFLKKVKDNPEYNTEEPDYDMLLDDWDGYDDQVYIQNKGDSIVFWEGWVDSCWKAAFQKEQYKGLKKSEVINKIIEERFPRIAEEFDMEIIDYGYIDNDGYIMYIEMKLKDKPTEKNISEYNSFSQLTDKDLYDIANWALFKEGYMLYDELTDDEAIDEIVNDFNLLLKSNYPEGFKNVPNVLTLYRIVKLKSSDELNKSKLGMSWFSDKERIEDKNFIDQLFNTNQNLYLITAEVPISNIDIPRSMVQRVMSYIENEVVIKDDTNISIIDLKKL